MIRTIHVSTVYIFAEALILKLKIFIRHVSDYDMALALES